MKGMSLRVVGVEGKEGEIKTVEMAVSGLEEAQKKADRKKGKKGRREQTKRLSE